MQYVPTELSDSDLAKKKDLTGAVWTQIDYKIKQNDQILDSATSKQEILNSRDNKLLKINDNEILIVQKNAFYIFENSSLLMSKIYIQSEIDGLNPDFSIIDISNFNLGIFLYLIDNQNNQKLILDL